MYQNVKTQRKVMSDFPGKIVGITFPVTLFFFCGKNFFFELVFSMKLIVKNFRNFFNEFH